MNRGRVRSVNMSSRLFFFKFCLLFNPQTGRNIFVQNSESGTFSNGRKVAGAVSITMPPEENEINGSQETIASMGW